MCSEMPRVTPGLSRCLRQSHPALCPMHLILPLLLVVGGYNSSNTTHLVEIGEQQLPTFFIRTADCLKSLEEIVHFDLHLKAEKESYSTKLAGSGPVTVGITAGASCPNNLIEDTVLRVFQLRGIDEAEIRAALA